MASNWLQFIGSSLGMIRVIYSSWFMYYYIEVDPAKSGLTIHTLDDCIFFSHCRGGPLGSGLLLGSLLRS